MIKKFLILRHGRSFGVGRFRVCYPSDRIRLAINSRRFLGDGAIRIFTAPEWEARFTAEGLASALGAPSPIIEPSLSDEQEDSSADDFIRERLADANPDIIDTHYKRLDPLLASIDRMSGIKLKIDEARIRHLNRAYLVDLEKGRVLVIKEKD